jgi:hypothetical protein
MRRQPGIQLLLKMGSMSYPKQLQCSDELGIQQHHDLALVLASID